MNRGHPSTDAERTIRRHDPRAVVAACVMLMAAVALVFVQTLNHEFVNYDDNLYISDNPHVTGGLKPSEMVWVTTHFSSGHWHPLTWLTHMLDWQLYGPMAGGHHLTSVLLHAANAVGLFLLLRSLTSDLWRSALVAAIFAIHPLRVESVAWAAERKDVLSGLFFVLTLAAYVRFVRRPFSWGRYVFVLVLFSLGLMSKAMLVTVPCVMLLLDYWPLNRVGRVSPAALVAEKIPIFAMSVASSIAGYRAQGELMASATRLPLSARGLNAFISYVAYLGQFFYPLRLAPFYPHRGASIPFWQGAAALVLLAAITLAALVWRRRYPALTVGWLWYLGMMLPVIGLTQAGDQAMADRYTYLPQIGFCMALVWAPVPSRRRVATGIVVLGLPLICCAAWKQTSYWRDSERLWTHALGCTTDNSVANYNLGAAYLARKQPDEAIVHYRQAVKMRPEKPSFHDSLGAALLQLGRLDEAILCFRRAIELQDDFAPAHNNLAVALAQNGNMQGAILEWRRTLQIDPGRQSARENLEMAIRQQDPAGKPSAIMP